jgi:1-acyl-sn-glycerol-3-phosphate acyltransferase
MRAATDAGLPRADVPAWQRRLRYKFVRTFIRVSARVLFKLRLDGADRIRPAPALYCFNHLGWLDPIAIMATFPSTVRLYFYGPKATDLRHGVRNRIMWWSGVAVPFRADRDDIISSVRRAEAVFDSGGILAIAGEGQIHLHEGDLLPLHEGPAYLALRAGVPIVPVAITGTSWVGFRRSITVRIGEPIPTGPRPTRAAVAEYTNRTWHAIRAMVAADRDLAVPGPFGRWFTDVFNDWGPGGRTAAGLRIGPLPDEVPFGPLAGSPDEAALCLRSDAADLRAATPGVSSG